MNKYADYCEEFVTRYFDAQWLNALKTKYFNSINVRKLDVAKQLNIALQLKSLSSNLTEYFIEIVTIIVCRIRYFTKIKTAQQLNVTR